MKLRSLMSPWGWGTIAPLVFAIPAFGLLLSGLDYGLDLSDETFYLIWLHDPQAYALTYQPFAYILHPLYAALGESLALVRFAGIVIQAGIGAFLGTTTSAFYQRRVSGFDGRGFVVVGALAGACNYVAWYLTPNYNMLANVGAMLVLAGWLRWFDGRRAAAILAIGLGITLSFFGKPPLAVVESGMTVALAFWSSDRRIVSHAGGLAALATFAIIAFTKNPLDMLTDSIASQRVLSLGTGLLDLPGRTYRELMGSQAVFPACAAAALLAFSRPGSIELPRKGLQFLGAFSLFFLALRFFGLWKGDENIDLFGLAFISFGLVLLAARRVEVERGTLLPILAMLLAPFAISLGTYNPLLTQLTLSSGFVLLAVVTLTRISSGWIAIEFGAYIAGVALLAFSWMHPQGRARAERLSEATITLPLTNTAIRVDEATANYADDLRRIGESNGMTSATPVVDLSGGVPATTLFLGGHAPVLPWLLSITPTWPDVAWSRMSPEERASAWIVGPIHPSFRQTQVATDVSVARYSTVGKAWMPTFEREVTILKPTTTHDVGLPR